MKCVDYQWFIYQNNKFNGIVFTVRARSLNTFTNAISNILAAWIINPLLDNMPFKRRKRAFIGLAYIFILYNAVCIGGYWAMKDTKMDLEEAQRLDIYDHNFAWWCFLFTMYGFVSGSYNVYAHWFIGALSNDPVEVCIILPWVSSCSQFLAGQSVTDTSKLYSSQSTTQCTSSSPRSPR